MQGIPRDLQLRVLRILDIDSRRILGVITHLNVPAELRTRLGESLKTRRQWSVGTATVELGPRRGGMPMYRLLVDAHSVWVAHRTASAEAGTWDEEYHYTTDGTTWRRLGPPAPAIT